MRKTPIGAVAFETFDCILFPLSCDLISLQQSCQIILIALDRTVSLLLTKRLSGTLEQRFSTSGPRPTGGPRSCFEWAAHAENLMLVLRGSLPLLHKSVSNDFF